MASPGETGQNFSVYPVEKWGDTFVVSPMGDAAGFSPSVVHGEMQALISQFKGSPGSHLILDLGRSNYFGSVIIGELIGLGQAVRNGGGRIAMCHVSQDMQDMLRIMKVDAMWELFPDREAALKAIATIPVPQQLWRLRIPVGIAVGLLAVWLGWLALQWLPNDDVPYYMEAVELWNRAERLKNSNPTPEDWRKFADETLPKAKNLAHRLEQRTQNRQAMRFLLWAIRDYYPKAVRGHFVEGDPNVASLKDNLEFAREIINQQDSKR